MQVKVFFAYVGLLSVAICSLLACSAFAQKASHNRYTATNKSAPRIPGAIGVEGDSHFQRIFTNSQVKVFRATIAPNEATLLCAHPHDYIVVSFGASNVEAVGEVTRLPLQMNDGDVQVLTGGWSHKLINRSTQAANLIVMEVVHGISPGQSTCGLNGQSCGQVRFGKTDDGIYTQSMLFETAKVRLLRAELGPGGVLPTHTDLTDHLIVTLNDARLGDGLDQPSGNATWMAGGLGTIRNQGSQDARLLILEIK